MSNVENVYTRAQALADKFGIDSNNPLIVAAIAQAYMDGQWNEIQSRWNKIENKN